MARRKSKSTNKNIQVGDEYLPTPEEIRAACLEIQKEWTKQIEQTRMGCYRRIPWCVPGAESDTMWEDRPDRSVPRSEREARERAEDEARERAIEDGTRKEIKSNRLATEFLKIVTLDYEGEGYEGIQGIEQIEQSE